MVGAGPGWGLAPAPGRIYNTYDHCYIVGTCAWLRFDLVSTVIKMTHHLSINHWLLETGPIFSLVYGHMGHTTIALAVRG
jgi:uncharacterized protein Usg